MRKLLALAVLIASTPLTPFAQQAQIITGIPVRDTTITVSITRNGRAPADRASLYFGVEAIGETVSASLERLQIKLKAMQDSAKRVSPTAQIDLPVVLGAAPSVQNGYPPPQSPLSVARAAIRVTVSKLTDLPLLQTAMSQAGATMNAGVSYESSTIETTWKAKTAEALQSARTTAELSATAQGYTLGRLLTMSVNGGPQQTFQQQVQLNFDARNNYSPMIAPEITVNATVNATYLLVTKK